MYGSFCTILVLLIGWHLNLGAGLTGQTLILTPDGLVALNALKISDEIIGYDPIADSFPAVPIKDIQLHSVDQMVAISTDKGVIYASQDQLFYDVSCDGFVAASELTVNSVLCTAERQECYCISIAQVDQPTMMYDITLQEPHLFFSSDAQILTHNMTAALVPLTEWILGAAIGCFTLDRMYKSFGTSEQAKQFVIQEIQRFDKRYSDVIDKKKTPIALLKQNVSYNPTPPLFLGIPQDPAIYHHMMSYPLLHGPMCCTATMQDDGDIEVRLYVMKFDYQDQQRRVYSWQELGRTMVDRNNPLVKNFVQEEDKKQIEVLRTILKQWPKEIVNLFINARTTIVTDTIRSKYPPGCYDMVIHGRKFGPHAMYNMLVKNISPLLVLNILDHCTMIPSKHPDRYIFVNPGYTIFIIVDKKTNIILNVGLYNAQDAIILEGGASKQQPEQEKEQPKEEETPAKTIEDILVGAKPGRETNGKAIQFEKPGNHDDAIKDFGSLELTNVREKDGIKLGDLPDGKTVNVRIESKDSRPTLEFYNPVNGRKIKIRYGEK
jgi:hypothetical protein